MHHVFFFPFFAFPIILIALIITAIVIFKKNRKLYANNAVNPMTILETRYVKGEITSEDYQSMREVLVNSRHYK